jgi:hypothetical protein
MATNVFPALDIPQPINPTEQMGKAMALRSMLTQQQMQQQQMAYQQQLQPLELQQRQNELAIQQQQIQDVKAGQDAFAEWDPTTGYDKLAELSVKHGSSIAQAQKIQQFGIDAAQKKAETLKATAGAAKDTAETNQINMKQISGEVNALTDPSVPDDQLASGLMTIANKWQGKGVDPQHYQMAQQLAQQSPQAIRQALPYIAKSYLSEADQWEVEGKKYTTQEAQQKAQVGAQEWKDYQTWQAAQKPGADTSYGGYQNYLAAKKAGGEAGARLGAEEQLAKYNFNLQQGMLPDALKGVAPHLVGAAAGQYEKDTNEYLTAKQSADEMQTLVNLARKGNVIGYTYSPITGVMQINTTEGIKKVNTKELGGYGAGGSALDRVAGWFGHNVSGKSIDPHVLDDMETVSQATGQNAENSYNNKISATNYAYGSRFQPTKPTTAAAAAQPRTLPDNIANQILEGHTATLSDGTTWTKQHGKVSQVK